MEELVSYMPYGLAILLALVFLTLFLLVFHKPAYRNRNWRSARLGVSAAFSIDKHRHLLLVRRDAVEHLLLVSRDGDLVIETHIAVAQPSADAGARKTGNPDATDKAGAAPGDAAMPVQDRLGQALEQIKARVARSGQETAPSSLPPDLSRPPGPGHERLYRQSTLAARAADQAEKQKPPASGSGSEPLAPLSSFSADFSAENRWDKPGVFPDPDRPSPKESR